jgi:esterase/lipase superfamily enzyme
MPENEIFALLLKCNHAQLDALTVLLNLNAAFLPGPNQAAATRASAIFNAVKQRGGTLMADLTAQLLAWFPPPAPPLPAPATKTILVLAANPLETDRLRLDEEVRLIEERLAENNAGRDYRLVTEWAVRGTDLSRCLLKYKPTIVHFSGHGSPTGEIILEADDGRSHPVAVQKLAELFAILDDNTECVVLNACYSQGQAAALAHSVGCVVGMAREIGDASALRFTAGFYRGLAFGQDYYKAFRLGCSEIDLAALPDALVPHFTTNQEDRVAQQALAPAAAREEAVVLVSPKRTWTAEPREVAPPARSEIAPRLYPVWFGTNRQPNDPNDLAKGFSARRDEQHVYYGQCKVAVPKAHKTGSLGSGWLKRFVTLTDDRIKLKELTAMAADAFWAAVKQSLADWDAGQRMALVLLHGYSVSFEEAALRAAQIGFDVKAPGLVAFFSWPSQGGLLSYFSDEASIEASESAITEFLIRFGTDSGAERVHVLAHSMGNRGLLRATQRIVQQAAVAAKKPFHQLLLAAPDVDTAVFRDLARAYQRVAERTTLYVSSKDRALASSGIIHDAPRAGFCPPITVLPDIDTIEVSNVDLTWLGHGYYGAAEALLYDMHELIWHATPPKGRVKLQDAVSDAGQAYWRIGK